MLCRSGAGLHYLKWLLKGTAFELQKALGDNNSKTHTSIKENNLLAIRIQVSDIYEARKIQQPVKLFIGYSFQRFSRNQRCHI